MFVIVWFSLSHCISLVLACDGLWDTLNEETVTQQIYAHLTSPNSGYSSGGHNVSYSARPVSAIATGSNSVVSTTSPAVVLRGGRVPAASGFVSGPSLATPPDDAFSHLAERLVFLARDKGSQDSTQLALTVYVCELVLNKSSRVEPIVSLILRFTSLILLFCLFLYKTFSC